MLEIFKINRLKFDKQEGVLLNIGKLYQIIKNFIFIILKIFYRAPEFRNAFENNK